MGVPYSGSAAAVAAVLTFLLLGCSERQEEKAPPPVAASNEVAVAAQQEEEIPMTEDQRKVERMNDFVSAGDVAEALRIARELMDSDSADIRTDVVDALGFVGKRALPDIEDMMADPDADVAQRAVDAWDMAIAEVESDRAKAFIVERAMKKVTKRETLDALAMQYSSMDEKVALQSLRRVIEGNVGKAPSVCAKAMFEHIAGEPWDSPERLAEILKEL